MRGARDRGHEVVGALRRGAAARPAARRGLPHRAGADGAQPEPGRPGPRLRRAARLFRAERFDLVHGHMPISGLLARAAARAAGVPRIAYTCHGFLFNQPGPAWRRGLSLGLEWAGRPRSPTPT